MQKILLSILSKVSVGFLLVNLGASHFMYSKITSCMVYDSLSLSFIFLFYFSIVQCALCFFSFTCHYCH